MAGTKDEIKRPEVRARRAGPKTLYIVSSSLKQLLSFPLVFSDLLVVDLTRCRCIWRRNCLHLKPVGFSLSQSALVINCLHLKPVDCSRPVDFSTFIFFFSKCIVSWWDCLPQVGRPLDDLCHCYLDFCDHYLVSLPREMVQQCTSLPPDLQLRLYNVLEV